MNVYNMNELSTTSESDSEYLVDSRYCRTTVKCKRKALKKTIKLIHGRCVVIYRGSGDLLPIAAKDADRNCYCDFVFVCHDPKPIKTGKETPAMPRSRSARHDSSTSDEDDDKMNNNNAVLQPHLNRHSFPFRTQRNDGSNQEAPDDSLSIGTESLTKNQDATEYDRHDENERSNASVIHEEIDVDVDELVNAHGPPASIIYFPSSKSTR